MMLAGYCCAILYRYSIILYQYTASLQCRHDFSSPSLHLSYDFADVMLPPQGAGLTPLGRRHGLSVSRRQQRRRSRSRDRCGRGRGRGGGKRDRGQVGQEAGHCRLLLQPLSRSQVRSHRPVCGSRAKQATFLP